MNGLYEADQAQQSKKELAGNQRHESPGSDPPLSSGRYRAWMAGWVDEKADYPGHQSWMPEMDAGQLPELAGNRKSMEWSCHEMYDPSVLPIKPSTSVSLQPRSSPELHHPINSEPDRKSLYSRRRGTPAFRHRSSIDPTRSDWPTVGVTGNSTSLSSRRQSKLHGSLHSVPNGGNEIPSSNAYTLHGDADAPYQPRVHPMSHEVSPEDPAPTTNYPLTNAVFPSSQKAALASLPSDMLSPISPMQDVHPPLTVASSNTLSHHGSSPRTLEHQEAGGQASFSSSPSQPIPKEPNDTFSFFDSLDSDNQSPLPPYDGMEPTVPIAPQTANIISQPFLPAFQNHYQSEELDVPSVSPQQHPIDLESFIQSNDSENVSEESGMTKFHTPRSKSSRFSPIVISSTSPPQSRRTQPDSQCAINIQSPPEPTLPSTAFHSPPFSRSLNRQTGIVTGPVMEMDGFGNSATVIQDLEQSDVEPSFLFPELQPWSPLDHFIVTNVLDLHSTDSQWYSNDHCQQAAPQHHSRDSGISQTPFVKRLPFCFDHNSSLVSRLASKQEQFDEHLNVIRKINIEWMQRIKESQPGLWSLCSTLSASDLFDRAMRTGKSFICGSPIESFEDVFALMHLAFAAAFLWTWQQDYYLFSALRDDALQWQHVLPSDEDKTRFLNVMDCWRLHELEPPPLFASACPTNIRSMKPQKPPYCGDRQTLWDSLKNGEVFKVFIAFVDSKWIRSEPKT